MQIYGKPAFSVLLTFTWQSCDTHVILICHLYRDTRYSWRHNFPFGLGKLATVYAQVLPRSFTNNRLTLFTWLSRFKEILWFSAIFPIWKFLRSGFAIFANYIDKHIGISSSAFDITCSDFNFKLCHSKISGWEPYIGMPDNTASECRVSSNGAHASQCHLSQMADHGAVLSNAPWKSVSRNYKISENFKLFL